MRGLSHNQTSCGFVRLILLLHRTRMKKEIQAGWVFKYYGLPRGKVVERCGILGAHDYQERDNQGEGQSCNKA